VIRVNNDTLNMTKSVLAHAPVGTANLIKENDHVQLYQEDVASR
jgi:hypothetical protein